VDAADAGPDLDESGRKARENVAERINAAEEALRSIAKRTK
jgi:hypothetical protein